MSAQDHAPFAKAAPETPSDTAPETALVPLKARHDGWTPQRQRDFIEALADTGSVTSATAAVGMTAASAYRLRRRADARAFDAAWEAALERALQRLIPVALDRAINGTVRQRFYHGEVIAEERVHSDRLLLHLLEKGSAMLGATRARRAHTEDWDGAMTALAKGASAPPEPTDSAKWQCWENMDGYWRTDAPPPPGFTGEEMGKRGTRDWYRAVTVEEYRALRRKQRIARHGQDAARRRFFGME